MKVLAFSDLHLYNKNPKFHIDKTGLSDLLKAQSDYVDELLDIFENDFECNHLLFLGDYTDSALLDPMTLEVATSILARIDRICRERMGKHAILLEGNHCMEDANMTYSVLNSLSKVCPRAHVVLKDQAITLGGVNYICIPYMGDFDKCREIIKGYNDNLDKAYCNVLLFHFPLIGASTDTGFQTERGVYLSDEDVCNFDLILGGDFHKPQKLKFESVRHAYYVGAPFVLTMNEVYERGARLIEIDENYVHSVSLLQNNYCYGMKSVDWSEFNAFIKTAKNLSKMILKVNNVPKDQIKYVDSFRSKLYNLFIMVENKGIINDVAIDKSSAESYEQAISRLINTSVDGDENKSTCLTMVGRLVREVDYG